MPSKINKLEVFHTEILFIPKDGSAWIDYDNGSNSIKINIKLLTNEKAPNDVGTRTIGLEDHAVMELSNWFSFDEMAVTSPTRLGVAKDGRELSVFIYGKKAGDFLRIETQFYLRGLNE